jgi:hypothetical protein
MKIASDDESYGDEEAERRMNEALRRAFMMPPKPQANVRRPRKKAVPTGARRPALKGDDDAGA